MRVAATWGWLAKILIVVLFIIVASFAAKAQATDELAALNKQTEMLHSQGKYAEAIIVARRSFALTEQVLGPDHPAVGKALNNLAELYREQGRYAEAEPLC